MIAYIGEVTNDKISYTSKNLPDYVYNNHKIVTWWEEPHYFNTIELPGWLGDQIPKPHACIVPLGYSGYSFEKVKDILKNIKSGTGLDSMPENIIHSSLMKLLRIKIDDLEEGLILTNYEKGVRKEDRPDFIALDKNGQYVIIECKSQGKIKDLDQIQRYSDSYKNKKHRLMLVAFNILPECRVEASKRKIECIECLMKFNKL